jgi:hypothetical protein
LFAKLGKMFFGVPKLIQLTREEPPGIFLGALTVETELVVRQTQYADCGLATWAPLARGNPPLDPEAQVSFGLIPIRVK